MNRRVADSIHGRLSLRPPQRESLDILARVAGILPLGKDQELDAALAAVRAECPTVEDFERDFPSLCFALATGVGKTRLMGAFISYLYLARGMRHFFVLAPNLTIYEKLIRDFTPGNAKYVFQGIAEFAQDPPEIITGDNYQDGRGARQDLFGERAIHINVFNISKINNEVRGGNVARIRRLSEYIGESYFDYLAALPDLVLLMDESHRYRASAGVRAINELRPVLGLELTATPYVEAGGRRRQPFRNVAYEYPLARAIRDGFVKEPAVATRENFRPGDHTPEQLERIKLEDGVRLHEATRVELESYARQHGRPVVKPFMLVVATDTEHAAELERTIRSEEFFEGRYADRVITVHSNQRGEEKEETVQRLLAVESASEPTEIVIHVNMLKEGWDVTNLYTIVPLRAANARTLVEQTIGRGLRLPYGRRTGVKAVDRLTIVAHDHFQEIVDEAQRGDSVIQMAQVIIGRDVPIERQAVVTIPSLVEMAFQEPMATDGGDQATVSPDGPPAPFTTPAEREVARVVYGEIRQCEHLPRSTSLRTPGVKEEIARRVAARLAPAQGELDGLDAAPDVKRIVDQMVEQYIEHTIDIPRITVVPSGEVTTGYRDFDLELGDLRLQPVDSAILVQALQSGERSRLEQGTVAVETRPEDYIVRALVDYDDISYDDHADLLYRLAGQAVAHLRGYLSSEDEVENVLQAHGRRLAELVHAQMQGHFWQDTTGYEAKVSRGFVTMRPITMTATAGEPARDFRAQVDERRDIRRMRFTGFRRCLFPEQRFDSDPERRFAMILESDPDGSLRWVKPGPDALRIDYEHGSMYEPDFVVERATEKLLCEVKRDDELDDAVVQAKARSAVTWCRHATEHELAHGGKPWRYLLIPQTAITANATLTGLAAGYAVPG